MNHSFIQDANAVEQIDGITYEFPYTMHERDLTSFTIPWHWHEELEFNYAYKGSVIVETVNRTYAIRQGEACFINTNIMNTKRKAEGTSSAIEHAHLFHPILLAGHYRSIFETKYLNPVLQNQSIEVIIIKEDTESRKEFLELLHSLTRMRQAVHTHERIKDILSFIHKHYQENITVASISEYANIRPKECIRSFKNAFHQTPVDYLIHYRIEQAKRLLRETDESVTNIAFMTGFHNSAYFGKMFKKLTGMTPGKFRQTHKTVFPL